MTDTNKPTYSFASFVAATTIAAFHAMLPCTARGDSSLILPNPPGWPGFVIETTVEAGYRPAGDTSASAPVMSDTNTDRIVVTPSPSRFAGETFVASVTATRSADAGSPTASALGQAEAFFIVGSDTDTDKWGIDIETIGNAAEAFVDFGGDDGPVAADAFVEVTFTLTSTAPLHLPGAAFTLPTLPSGLIEPLQESMLATFAIPTADRPPAPPYYGPTLGYIDASATTGRLDGREILIDIRPATPGVHGDEVLELNLFYRIDIPHGTDARTTYTISGNAGVDDGTGTAGPDCERSFGPVESPNGHFYEVVFGCDWSWEAANREANLRIHAERSGHLATLTSAPEDDFVEKLRQDALISFGIDPFDPATAPQLWVGGFQEPDQEEINQGWFWVNGEGTIPEPSDPGFSNWLADEPNDYGLTYRIEDNEENSLTIGFNGLQGWNDQGGRLRGYVVEYDAEISVLGPAVRLERIGNVRKLERRVATRRIIAEDPDSNDSDRSNEPPEIFIYDSGSQALHGPFESGVIVRFVFTENGKPKAKKNRRFVALPVRGIPFIVARNGQGVVSEPLVLDIPAYFPNGGGEPDPDAELVSKEWLSLTVQSPGTASYGPIASCALGLRSFDFAYLNGDHNAGRFEIMPVADPVNHTDLAYSMALADNDGSDPVRYHVSFCDLQDVGELITARPRICPGGDCRLILPRPTRPDEIAIIGGFSFATLSGNNHFLREVKVVPDGPGGFVDVTWRDDDGNDPYLVSVQVVYAQSSAFETGGAVNINAPNGTAVRYRIYGAGDPILRSFHLRYNSASHRIGRIGINMDTLPWGTARLQDNGNDKSFSGEIRWVRRVR